MWSVRVLVFACALLLVSGGGFDDDPEVKALAEKVKGGLCASPQPEDKVNRFFECDHFVDMIVSLLQVTLRLSMRLS